MARWVNEQPTLPLDLRELDTNTGERDGALIEAAAAYSLRKLKEDFTGDVVEVRRNVDGETEGFTAAEVTDGTLEKWVKGYSDLATIDTIDSVSDEYYSVAVNDQQNFNITSNLVSDDLSGHLGKKYITFISPEILANDDVLGKYLVEFNVQVNSGSLGTGNSDGLRISGRYNESGAQVSEYLTQGFNSYEFTLRETPSASPQLFFASEANSKFDVSISNFNVYKSTVNELPLDQATGAAAAYSLRNLSSSYTGDVVEVRRSSDEAVQAFTASEVADGTLTDWVNVGNDYVGYARFQDASTANVNLSSSFTLEASKSWSIKFECIVGELPAGLFGKSDFSNGGFWFANPTTVGLTDDSDSYQALSFGTGLALNLGQNYELEFFNTPSEGVRVAVDGTTMSTTPKVYGDITINKIGVSRGRAGERVIHNVRVDLNGDGTLDYSYAGDGNQASNWIDRVGSNNGTPTAQVLAYDNEYTDGHVRTWYDQSGSDNHAVQTTPANQPKIVEGGTLVADGIDFDGSTTQLDITGFSPVSLTYGAFTVASIDDNTASNLRTIFDSSDSTNGGFAVAYGNTASKLTPLWYDGDDTAVNVFSGGNNLTSSKSLYSLVIKTGASTTHVNGSLNETVTNTWTTAGSNTLSKSTIGYDQDTPGRQFNGRLQELIIYDSDQSTKRRAIEENIANHYDISLAAFSRDGTVKTWYDQSGNTNDATQTDPTKQPKIVVNGSLVQKRNKPSIKFADDSSDERYLTSPADIGSSFSFFASWQPLADDVTTGSGAAQKRNSTLLYGSGSLYIAGINSDFTNGYKSGAGADSYSAGIDFQKSLNLHTIIEGSADINYFGNGTNEIDGSGDASTVTATKYYIGSKVVVPTHNTRGYISELIHYNTDQSDNRTAIEANIGETYGITAIPAANDTVNGFVQTWYDQSGSGNDSEQGAASLQPKIVSNGLYLNEIDFDGTQCFSKIASGVLTNIQNTYITCVSKRREGSEGYIVQASDGANRFFVNPRRATIGSEAALIAYNNPDSVDTLLTITGSSGSYNAFKDGVDVNDPESTASTGAGQFTIGASSTGGAKLNGTIKELIVYDSDQSANRLAIEANVKNALEDSVDVFIMMGQSNMVGFNVADWPPTTYLSGANDDKVWISSQAGTASNDQGDLTSAGYDTGGFIKLDDYAAQSRYGYGPNLDFARTLVNTYDYKSLAIIKWARNGTSIDVSWKKSANKFYNPLVSFINNQIEELRNKTNIVNVRIAGFIWFQGHGDSAVQSRAEAYETNLTQLVADLRADVNSAANAQIIIARSPDFWKLPFEPGEPDANAQRVTNVDTIKTAQQNVAENDGNGLWVNTDDYDYREPWVSGVAGNRPVHLTTDAKQSLGIRLADTVVSQTNYT